MSLKIPSWFQDCNTIDEKFFLFQKAINVMVYKDENHRFFGSLSSKDVAGSDEDQCLWMAVYLRNGWKNKFGIVQKTFLSYYSEVGDVIKFEKEKLKLNTPEYIDSRFLYLRRTSLWIMSGSIQEEEWEAINALLSNMF